MCSSDLAVITGSYWSGIPGPAHILICVAAATLAGAIWGVILANLVIGENVVPEFLQFDCTPEKLSAALVKLLGDTAERRRQIEAFNRLDTIMEIGRAAPSDRAATLVLDCAGSPAQPERETVASATPTA